MRKLSAVTAAVAVAAFLASASSFAGTADEIKALIHEGNAYAAKNLKGQENTYSKDGSMEFWSSGGLMQRVTGTERPEEYESISITAKHIQVIELVPGQAAVAMFYSEGRMKPKGAPGVSHYLTRATIAYVKEGGKWKVRAAHWSPIAGGSGTSQTTLD